MLAPAVGLIGSAAVYRGTAYANGRYEMASAFAKPDKVLGLAGLALADLAVLVSAQQYVPTIHLAKTSFWSGTKINLIRFGSYPNTGLIELARAEAVARAGTWTPRQLGTMERIATRSRGTKFRGMMPTSGCGLLGPARMSAFTPGEKRTSVREFRHSVL